MSEATALRKTVERTPEGLLNLQVPMEWPGGSTKISIELSPDEAREVGRELQLQADFEDLKVPVEAVKVARGAMATVEAGVLQANETPYDLPGAVAFVMHARQEHGLPDVDVADVQTALKVLELYPER